MTACNHFALTVPVASMHISVTRLVGKNPLLWASNRKVFTYLFKNYVFDQHWILTWWFGGELWINVGTLERNSPIFSTIRVLALSWLPCGEKKLVCSSKSDHLFANCEKCKLDRWKMRWTGYLKVVYQVVNAQFSRVEGKRFLVMTLPKNSLNVKSNGYFKASVTQFMQMFQEKV